MTKERWFGTHIMEVIEMFRNLKLAIGTNSVSNKDFEERLQYLNKCLCCAERGIASYAEMYGTGNSEGYDCSSEVCVLCLESGCSCGGRRLEKAPHETHIGCNCKEANDG